MSVTIVYFSTANPASTFSKSHYRMFAEGKETQNNDLLVLDLCHCPPFLKTIYFTPELRSAWCGKLMTRFANEVNYKEDFKLAYSTWYSPFSSRGGLILFSWERLLLAYFEISCRWQWEHAGSYPFPDNLCIFPHFSNYIDSRCASAMGTPPWCPCNHLPKTKLFQPCWSFTRNQCQHFATCPLCKVFQHHTCCLPEASFTTQQWVPSTAGRKPVHFCMSYETPVPFLLPSDLLL